jgi:hypothetical protein
VLTRSSRKASRARAAPTSGAQPTPLAEGINAVAAIDERRADKQAAIDASLGMTKVLPAGTMAKFWAVVVLVPVVIGVTAYGVSRWMGPADVASSGSSGTSASGAAPQQTGGRVDGQVRADVLDDEGMKDATVKAYRANPNDEARRQSKVLASDIMMLSSSADRAPYDVHHRARTRQAELAAAQERSA